MEAQLAPVATPRWSGIFTLPKFDSGVPPVITRSGLRSTLLARFARAAERVGVPLPDGTFESPEKVLAAQWQQMMQRLGITSTHATHLAGHLRIDVDDERLYVWNVAAQNLNAYRAKPVVERLEAAAPGLGWFVYRCIHDGHGHGLSLYDFARSSYDGLPYELQEISTFTDDAYAVYLFREHGFDLDEDGELTADAESDGEEDFDPPMTSELVEKIRARVGGWWPSTILEEVEGHAHLLEMQGVNCPRPKTMSLPAVRRWLKLNPEHADAALVSLAAQLQAAFNADSRKVFESGYAHDLEIKLIGAPAFICWDSMELLFEMVEHMERDCYESGEDANEAFSVAWLNKPDQITDEQLRQLAKDLVAHLKRWKLLAELMSHFPIWKEDFDES